MIRHRRRFSFFVKIRRMEYRINQKSISKWSLVSPGRVSRSPSEAELIFEIIPLNSSSHSFKYLITSSLLGSFSLRDRGEDTCATYRIKRGTRIECAGCSPRYGAGEKKAEEENYRHGVFQSSSVRSQSWTVMYSTSSDLHNKTKQYEYNLSIIFFRHRAEGPV